MVGKSVVCLSFMRYCARAAFIRFGKKVRYWMIFNEINSAFLFPVLSHEIIPKTGATNKQASNFPSIASSICSFKQSSENYHRKRSVSGSFRPD